jgi:hypothetical protein
MLFHWISLLLVTLWIHLPVISTKELWIWTYKSPNIGVKNFSPVGPIAGFNKSLNVEHFIFYLKMSSKKTSLIQCSELNQDEVCSLRTNENKEDSKHQNKHDLWFGFLTEKVVFIFAYIFNIFARKLKIWYQSPNDEKCMELPYNHFFNHYFVIWFFSVLLLCTQVNMICLWCYSECISKPG